MTPPAWPTRLIPRRSPPVWLAALITLAAMAAAIGVRAAFVGPSADFGRSVTYFPAFIIATLYASQVWGWIAVISPPVLAYALRGPTPQHVLTDPVTYMYLASGAVTVLVASALRSVLIELEETQVRQQTTQQVLDQAAAHLQLAQEAGGVGLYDLDLQTRRWTWSATLYRNLGLDPSTKPSWRTLLSTVHPDDLGAVAALNSAEVKRSGRVPPVEYRVVWPDGSVHWLMSQGEFIADEAGEPVRAVGVTIDVTERRLRYEQLAESEARFRALANSAPVLMWVSRPDGSQEFINKTYADFMGVDYETALHRDWREILHPDDVERVLEGQRSGERKRGLFVLEARYLVADGSYHWIRSISQPRIGPDGEFAGYIGIGMDITEAKLAEENLKHINDLLAERVQAALAERDKAETALHRGLKLEAVGQLTGGVAHDFNNLLTVIIGALDMMQRHPNDAARRDRMVEAALSAARRGERLTHQLLVFARRSNLKPEIVHIDELLRESEPLLRRAVGESVELTFAAAAEGGAVRVDPSQLESALMNLVVNARDAVTGGGAIRVETLRCRLAEGEVEETPAGEYLCLAVHDTGVGMDAKTLARAFEPFFTTKEVGKGTGLGLSQIYGFARQSGGGVAIDSAPGKGATVRVYLPFLQEEAVAQPAEAAPAADAAPSGPSLDVLLVEDDLPVGDMIAALLEDAGHRVRRAADAAEALAILRRPDRVDLMVTDVVMPGAMSGVDLAHEAVALRPALPIILSSGYTGDALKSAAGSPWPLLLKPYSAEDLSRAIADLLERAAAAE